MYRLLILLITIGAIACTTREQAQQELSELEKWKLGWRMIESSWAEDHSTVALQFDSLLAADEVTDMYFLITGLESLHKLGEERKILKTLASIDKELLPALCSRDAFRDHTICSEMEIPEVENPELQLKLIRMYIDDQAVRGNMLNDLIVKYGVDESKIKREDGISVDRWNREVVQEVIEKHGFPTKKLVGREAMSGVFYVIQHADQDPDWQKSQLENIEVSVKNGDMDGERYAYLYDRIKVNAGELQRYGTQFKNVDFEAGIVELADTEDLENLDARRMEVGLMPIEMYKGFMLSYVK